MKSVTGTIENGAVVPDGQIVWPDGTKVEITPHEAPGKLGLEEPEWRDDAEALRDWEAWIRTIEPLEIAPEEQAAATRFHDEMRRFNLEAVRRGMGGGAAE